MVALAILSLFLLPERIFALTSRIPARARMSRTALPAILPLLGAGIIITIALEYFEKTWWGMDIVLVRGTVMRFLLAARIALSMAKAVSKPLPVPIPTKPRRLPIAKTMLILNLFPPEVTRVTRLT